MATCPFCTSEITSHDGFVVCPVCNTLYHDACWRQNGNHCSILGCIGAGERIVFNVGQGTPYRPKVKPAGPAWRFRVPAETGGRLLLAANLVSGALVWSFLSWAALSLFFMSAPLLPFGWQPRANTTGLFVIGSVVGGGFGLTRAAKNPTLERRRLLSVILSFLAFRLLAEAVIAIYSFGGFSFESPLTEPTLLRALAGPSGALIAGLWFTAGQAIVSVGLSALLGLYFSNTIYFLWPGATEWSVEVRLALMAIILAAAVMPLLMPLPLHGLLGAAVASSPGLLLLRTYHFNPSSGFAGFPTQYAVLAVILSLPFAGLVHAQGIPPASLSRRGLSFVQIWEPVKRGVLAAAFVLLSAGLGAVAVMWLKPLSTDLVAIVPPVVGKALAPDHLYVTWIRHADGLLLSLPLVYAAIFALGRLARRGLLQVLYRFLRWVYLTSVCCLVVIAIGRGLGAALRAWPALQAFGDYPDWIVLSLYGMAGLLAIVFALGYTKDHMPFPLVGLGFAMWFLQMVLLSVVLAFLGAVLGLWSGKLIGPLLAAGNPQGVLGMPWEQAITVGGLLLGFSVGVGWFLVKWMRGDLGVIVTHYRRLALKYCQLLDGKLDGALDSLRPWWAVLVLAAVALWTTWGFVQVIAPVLGLTR